MTNWPDRLVAMERAVTGDDERKSSARLWAEETVRFALTLANIALFTALVIAACGT